MKTHRHKKPSALRARLLRFAPDLFALGALVLFGLLAALRYHLVEGEQDIGVYGAIAERAMQAMQGSDVVIASEYPPLATVLFWFAKALIPHTNFAVPWLLLMVTSVFCTWAYLRCYSVLDACLFAILMPLAVLLLGHDLIFSRFDLYVAIALLLSWRTHRHGSYAESAGWLCAAVLLKAVPVLVVPFFLLTLPRRSFFSAFTGACVALIATGILCYGVLGVDGTLSNIAYALSYHGHRPVQIETLWSGVFMLFTMMAGGIPHTGFANMSIVNHDVPMLIATVAKGFILAGIAVLAFQARRMRMQQQYGSLMIIVMLGALVLSPVLSPQYFVWIIPLILFYVAEKFVLKDLSFSLVASSVATVLIAYLTQWIFPAHYQQLMGFQWSAIFALNIRNGLMVFLFFLLLIDTGLLHLPRKQMSPSLRGVLLRMGTQACIFALAVMAFVTYRPMFLTTTGNVTVSYLSQKTVVQTLPVFIDAPDKTEMTIQTMVHVEPWSQHRFFTISVDDCLRSITVNDQQLPSDIGFCGTESGRIFDIGAYIKNGDNLLTLVVRNDGRGLAGANIVPVMTGSLFMILFGLGLLSIWYGIRLMQGFVLLSQTSAAAKLLEMLYTLFARWTTSRFAPTASSTFSPSTQRRLSI